MMSNAARDPVFWAGVAIAHQDSPGTTEECVRCHTPTAFLEGRGGAISPAELQPQDLAGIHCDACHRMMDDGVTPAGNAHYTIDDTEVGGVVPKRGPWTYAVGEEPPHSTLEGTLQATSRLCGTCHDVTTPRERVDASGVGLGVQFNEQRTYSEWLGSAYAQPGPDARTCQDCHMPAVADVTGCSTFVGMSSHATGGRRHDLVGANRFVTELLRDLYGSAGDGSIADVYFDTSLARMDELLAGAALLELTPPASVDAGAGFSLDARVTNLTGHKLPTGYSEGRVMWLEVTATYSGTTVWNSGEYSPITGLAPDPHLRTWSATAEDGDDGTTFHLLRNNRWVEDTRIPPLGLTPNLETDPVGDRYTLVSGSWPNFDAWTYDFGPSPGLVDTTPADATDDLLHVEARLLLAINTPQYVAFLASANTTNTAGTDVQALFDDKGGAPPVVLATWSADVPLTGLAAGGGSSSSGSSSTSGGSTAGSASDAGSSATSSAGSTGSGGGSEGGGGCGCASDPGRSRTSAAIFAALVLARRRRPRRA